MAKTFVIHGAVGSISVTEYNHGTDTSTTTELTATAVTNDHNVGAIGRRSDGRLLALYSEHTGNMFARVSTNAGDSTAWGSAVTVDAGQCTYPKLVHLSAEGTSGRWYVFYRRTISGNNRPQYYATSDDDGATWATPVQLTTANAERPYFQIATNGVDRIDCFYTNGHPREVATSVYHAYYDGSWRDTSGTVIGPADFAVTDGTLVYDGTSIDAWTNGVQYRSGSPELVFFTYPSSTDHRSNHARWNGSAWVVSEIVATGRKLYEITGEDQYSSGVCFDPTDVNAVFLSREVATDRWEMERYVTADTGATWTLDKSITSASTPAPYKHMRPYPVPGGGPFSMAWLFADFVSYTSWTSQLWAYAPPAPAAASVTFLQSATSTADSNTYTFSGQSLGAETADRVIIVAVGYRVAGAAANIGVTIGGVSASPVVEAPYTVGNTNYAGLFSLAVPSGTSADIVVSLSRSVIRCGIAVFGATGTANATAADTAAHMAASNPTTSAVTVASGGFIVGAVLNAANGATTWSGLTERSDEVIESAVNWTTASDNFASGSTPTITATVSSVAVPAGVFAAWSPA